VPGAGSLPDILEGLERGVQVVGDVGEAPWKRELLCSADVIIPML
jgi:hypothetical protein